MASILEALFGQPGSAESASMYPIAAGLLRGDLAGGLLGAGQMLSPEAKIRRGLLDTQLQDAQQSLADKQRAREFLSNLPNPQFQAGVTALAGGGGPTVANATRVQPASPMTQTLYEGVRAGAIPLGDYLKAVMPKPLEFGKIDPKDYTAESLRAAAAAGDYSKLVPVRKLDVVNNRAVDLYQTKPGTVFDTFDPNKPFNLQGGQVVPNTPLQNFELSKSRAGATNVSVNTDKSYFGNFSEARAKSDAALVDAAQSAPERVQTAQRVKKLLAENPITGTGAEARLSLNRALVTGGLIDGKNVADTETLASTLASQTLDAIKTSGLGSGQGFTDKDRQFLERARSGNIEMNAQTLGRLADLNERSARVSIQRGNAIINKIRSTPQSGQAGQFLDPIPEPPPLTVPSVVRQPTQPAAPAGVRFLGFE